jgi:hypothetical protein
MSAVSFEKCPREYQAAVAGVMQAVTLKLISGCRSADTATNKTPKKELRLLVDSTAVENIAISSLYMVK